MEKEFPTAGEAYTIRVMFKRLDSEKKTEFKDALAAIENVDSVTYDMTGSDYNSGEYTLYILNTKYGYDTEEEAAVERQVKEKFSDYEVTVKNDDTSAPDIPLSVYLAAFGIILVILLISCGSYFEPVLFLITIGIAVVLNLGTNFFLGEISDVSFGIAAVLQLALSMDYSIILMNRYRQELKKTDDRKEAMANALRAAIGSITGSAVTTIVGLHLYYCRISRLKKPKRKSERKKRVRTAFRRCLAVSATVSAALLRYCSLCCLSPRAICSPAQKPSIRCPKRIRLPIFFPRPIRLFCFMITQMRITLRTLCRPWKRRTV